MNTTKPGILRHLRSLTPRRHGITFDEALRIAELQAARLVELATGGESLRESDIADLPRIKVVYEHLQVSGMSHWNGDDWIISLNRRDTWARQRFTLMHEFKHIVDHGSFDHLYRGNTSMTAAQQAERAADYFAGCALVPKRYLKAAWGHGMQRLDDLATHFGVSHDAMTVRLAQTRLNAPDDAAASVRCARPVRTPAGQSQRFRVARTPYRRGALA